MPYKIPRLKASEVIDIIQHHGFVFITQRGSHQKWRNHESGKQVIIPIHKSKDLPLGTLKSIIDGSGIPADEFRK